MNLHFQFPIKWTLWVQLYLWFWFILLFVNMQVLVYIIQESCELLQSTQISTSELLKKTQDEVELKQATIQSQKYDNALIIFCFILYLTDILCWWDGAKLWYGSCVTVRIMLLTFLTNNIYYLLFVPPSYVFVATDSPDNHFIFNMDAEIVEIVLRASSLSAITITWVLSNLIRHFQLTIL